MFREPRRVQEQLRALLSSGAAPQILELAASLRGTPLPPPAPDLIRVACPAPAGVDWFLVSDKPHPLWLRAVLVSDWLVRWAPEQPPPTAWLAAHAIHELCAHRDPVAIRRNPPPGLNHRLLRGTARLLRQQIPDASQRLFVDLVSEDRADWQRTSTPHRDAVQILTAGWIARRLDAGPHKHLSNNPPPQSPSNFCSPDVTSVQNAPVGDRFTG